MRRVLAFVVLVCMIVLSGAVPAPSPIAISPFVQAQERQWDIECVFCELTFRVDTDQFVALDAQDHLHLAYGGDHLYYTTNVSGAWVTEVADPAPGVGRRASIAIDANGRPHIIYYDSLHNVMKYARKAGGGWVIEPVTRTDGPVSLVLDSQGRPHIAFTENTLVYYGYRRDNGTWTFSYVQDVAGYSVSGSSPVLTLDASGLPRIVYVERLSPTVAYARYVGSYWEIAGSDPIPGKNVIRTALTFDSHALPRAVFAVEREEEELVDLYYVRWDGTRWNIVRTEVAPSLQWAMLFTTSLSLTFDKNEIPHLAISLCSSACVGPDVHLKLVGNEWVGAFYYGTRLVHLNGIEDTIRFGRHNEPFLSYYLSETEIPSLQEEGVLGVTYNTTGEWTEEILARSRAVVPDRDTALSLDHANMPHLLYTISGSWGHFQYATITAGSWDIRQLDCCTGSMSLATDQQGYAHITFSETWKPAAVLYAKIHGEDPINYEVLYMHHPGAVGDVSIAVDSLGTPHLVYFVLEPFTDVYSLKYSYTEVITQSASFN